MEPIIIGLEAVVKAHTSTDGRRIIECEASNQEIDLEGDVILQRALLGSAKSFITNGHIDIDHLSELGPRVGIKNPESYIIGRPLEVNDLGDGRTGVVSEIMRSHDGKVDIVKNRFDSFWESLQGKPAVKWRASIYGFPAPDLTSDCREEVCEVPAKRYLVRGLDWRSLAMTRKPINDSIKGYARIITAKAMIKEMAKDGIVPFGLNQQNPTQEFHEAPFYPHVCPKSINELWGQYNLHISKECPHTMGYSGVLDSTAGFTDHFKACCGAEPEMASLLAHCLMWLVIKQKNRLNMI